MKAINSHPPPFQEGDYVQERDGHVRGEIVGRGPQAGEWLVRCPDGCEIGCLEEVLLLLQTRRS